MKKLIYLLGITIFLVSCEDEGINYKKLQKEDIEYFNKYKNYYNTKIANGDTLKLDTLNGLPYYYKVLEEGIGQQPDSGDVARVRMQILNIRNIWPDVDSHVDSVSGTGLIYTNLQSFDPYVFTVGASSTYALSGVNHYITKMKTLGTSILVLPSELAYGRNGLRSIGVYYYDPLVYTITLTDVD